MYYPILRARQFELITLRELANEEITQGYVIPILEPVTESNNNLTLAYNVFLEKDQTVYFIVNPIVGKVYGDDTLFLDYIKPFNNDIIKPAFYYHNNAGYIKNSINEYDLNDCMLICNNDISSENDEFREIVNLDEITTINIEDPGRNRSLDRYIKSLNKTFIRLDDFFEKQVRNSDYLNIGQHRFSEEHLYYNQEGYNGFSDYTVLPSEFSDGGSTPRAVVIHLTYLNGENQIWIRHFTSETNDSIANVQGKFAEASEKAVRYCRDKRLTNSAIQELENYFDKEHYPGLGTVKKISIKNHILVVKEYLANK